MARRDIAVRKMREIGPELAAVGQHELALVGKRLDLAQRPVIEPVAVPGRAVVLCDANRIIYCQSQPRRLIHLETPGMAQRQICLPAVRTDKPYCVRMYFLHAEPLAVGDAGGILRELDDQARP